MGTMADNRRDESEDAARQQSVTGESMPSQPGTRRTSTSSAGNMAASRDQSRDHQSPMSMQASQTSDGGRRPWPRPMDYGARQNMWRGLDNIH